MTSDGYATPRHPLSVEAWVNWNPTPKVHAFGRVMPGKRQTVVGMCGITVREKRGTFDPAASDACEDCARYVSEGLTVEEARRENSKRIAKWLEDLLGPHKDHPWHKVGRCVYCGPCGVRLYQGDLPEGQAVYTPPLRRTAADDMRTRWGMD